jgi:F420-dependent oxidoreductase-like protein
MNLGVMLGYWGLSLSAHEQLRIVQAAENLGYDSIWTAEAYGSDAATVLGWLAAQTTTISLGSAIFQIPARTPAMTAMTAATLDQLSGGRFRLGLGPSGPQVSEGWHGVRFAKQLQRTREYIDVVRMALARERVAYDGETLQLPLPDGPGKPLKLTISPVQERIPIYLAALGPNNVRLTGEIADGWLPVLLSPEHIDVFTPLLQDGADTAGRSLDDIDVSPVVNVLVTDDLEAGRDAMRPFLSLYLGGMGSREKNFYVNVAAEYGFGDAARKVQDLYLGGLKDQAAAALPDALIDAVSIVGPPDVVRERLGAFQAAGVGSVLCSAVLDMTVDEKIRQLELVAEAAAAVPA